MESLRHQFPESPEVVERVESLLSGLREEQLASLRKKSKELTLDRIYDLVDPSSMAQLTRMLTTLIKAGVLEKIVRVESPGLGGLGDFTSLSEVPEVIFDPNTDQDLRITPSNLKMIFRLSHV